MSYIESLLYTLLKWYRYNLKMRIRGSELARGEKDRKMTKTESLLYTLDLNRKGGEKMITTKLSLSGIEKGKGGMI